MYPCPETGVNDLENHCPECSNQVVEVIDLTSSPNDSPIPEKVTQNDYADSLSEVVVETEIIEAQVNPPVSANLDIFQAETQLDSRLDFRENAQSMLQFEVFSDMENEDPMPLQNLNRKPKSKKLKKTRVLHPRSSKTFGRFLVKKYYKQKWPWIDWTWLLLFASVFISPNNNNTWIEHYQIKKFWITWALGNFFKKI